MKLTICAADIDSVIQTFIEEGVVPENWVLDAGLSKDGFKYDKWLHYFQVRTNNVAELEDLLELCVCYKVPYYILESDDAEKYCDSVSLPMFKKGLRESSSEKYAIVATFDGQWAPRYYYGNGIWDDFDEESLDSGAWNGLNRTLVNLRQIPEEDLDDVVVYTLNTGEEFQAKEFLEKYDLRIRENKKIVRRQPRPVGHIR